MAYKGASFAEIESKLRQDFARRLKEQGHGATETVDPILRILFRTFAGQLETLYSDTERIREALLDELISGLGIERRMARPAQTIIRFFEDGLNELIPAGTEVVGVTQSKARLTFVTDATIAVSPARIAFAATYQDESLQLLPGMEMPDQMQAGHPSPDAVPAQLGPSPALFLAIENLPPEHLSHHGLFFDVSSPQLQQGLRREIWRLANSNGMFGAAGILRANRRNGGVHSLRWLVENVSDTPDDDQDRPQLPDGFYAGRVFVFPECEPARRRFLCKYPSGMEQSLARIFQGYSSLFAAERAWLRISIPPGIKDLRTAIHSVALHAISASNVMDLNQTVKFEAQGTSIPVEQQERYLVAPIAITGGNDNADYISAFQSSTNAGVGRYAVRNGRVDLIPPKVAGQAPPESANVPTWVTNGALGNTVAPGNIQTFVRASERPALRISNPMPAAGGTNGEAFADAQQRFAHVLLSRSRVVTMADVKAAVKALDRRIVRIDVADALRRTEDGLYRVVQITAFGDRNEFVDPDEEMRILREDIARHLLQRLPFGTELTVEWQWEERAARK
jgi:hypothetical protein